MDLKEEGQQLSGGCRACLAIPGRFIEVFPQDPNSAVVEAFGIRLQVDVTLIQDDKPATRRLGPDPRRIRDEQNQRTGCLDQMRTLAMLGETEPPCKKFAATDWEKRIQRLHPSNGGTDGAYEICR